MKKFMLILALNAGLLAGAHATEVDNTTSYYVPLADAEQVLNERVQVLIESALRGHRGCSTQALAHRASHYLIGNFVYGAIEHFANTSDKVERAYTPVGESIYSNTPYQGGIVDLFVNLGPTVNVAGHRVGTDKLGHFFDMGYDLFKRAEWGRPISSLLGQSRWEEAGLWGLYTTGVKSYGDIASNFDGYRFWRELAGQGSGKYFVCEAGKLRQVRWFKWSDYASSAWNEAINCSEYWSDDYVTNVDRNVRALEERTGRRYACPIALEQCGQLREYYAQWIPRDQINELVSPLCR